MRDRLAPLEVPGLRKAEARGRQVPRAQLAEAEPQAAAQAALRDQAEPEARELLAITC